MFSILFVVGLSAHGVKLATFVVPISVDTMDVAAVTAKDPI